jgi:hypothetical protein
LFDPFVQGYEQVVINRLQITLPSGPEQTDTRPVSVSARIGVDNVDTSHGVNIGRTTSDSAPGPWLTNLRSEYDFGPLPYSGFSEGSNELGGVQHWVFETTDQYALSSFFTLSTGDATLVGEGCSQVSPGARIGRRSP